MVFRETGGLTAVFKKVVPQFGDSHVSVSLKIGDPVSGQLPVGFPASPNTRGCPSQDTPKCPQQMVVFLLVSLLGQPEKGTLKTESPKMTARTWLAASAAAPRSMTLKCAESPAPLRSTLPLCRSLWAKPSFLPKTAGVVKHFCLPCIHC